MFASCIDVFPHTNFHGSYGKAATENFPRKAATKVVVERKHGNFPSRPTEEMLASTGMRYCCLVFDTKKVAKKATAGLRKKIWVLKRQHVLSWGVA